MILRMFRGTAALLAVLVPFTSAASDMPVVPEDAVHARFVVLGSAGGETVAYARAIIDPGYACPTVTGGPKPLPMATRRNPHHFPVIVCEAVIGKDESLALQLADAKLTLPTVSSQARRILVFGDTGCKIPKPGSSEGCPPGQPAEPFASLAAAAAAGEAVDLVVHVGDYNYRGTYGPVYFTTEEDGEKRQVAQWTYDAGDSISASEKCGQANDSGYWDMNAPNANLPDTWENWRDDFFGPAKSLLTKAPWAVSRGNHELCSRAGPGWFYFLDPHSDLTGEQLSCKSVPTTTAPIDGVTLTPPYAVAVGALTLLMLDSSNACDFFVFPDSPFDKSYQKQLVELAGLAPKEGNAWLVSHRPVWGVQAYEEEKTTACTPEKKLACMNQVLQEAVRDKLQGSLPESVKLLVAGHMHLFQTVTFPTTSRPPVVVAGNGGVKLIDTPGTSGLDTVVDAQAARVVITGDEVKEEETTKPAFGYLEITLADDGTWSGTMKNPVEDLVIAECGTAQQAEGSVCELAKGVVLPDS